MCSHVHQPSCACLRIVNRIHVTRTKKTREKSYFVWFFIWCLVFTLHFQHVLFFSSWADWIAFESATQFHYSFKYINILSTNNTFIFWLSGNRNLALAFQDGRPKVVLFRKKKHPIGGVLPRGWVWKNKSTICQIEQVEVESVLDEVYRRKEENFLLSASNSDLLRSIHLLSEFRPWICMGWAW